MRKYYHLVGIKMWSDPELYKVELYGSHDDPRYVLPIDVMQLAEVAIDLHKGEYMKCRWPTDSMRVPQEMLSMFASVDSTTPGILHERGQTVQTLCGIRILLGCQTQFSSSKTNTPT